MNCMNHYFFGNLIFLETSFCAIPINVENLLIEKLHIALKQKHSNKNGN